MASDFIDFEIKVTDTIHYRIKDFFCLQNNNRLLHGMHIYCFLFNSQLNNAVLCKIHSFRFLPQTQYYIVKIIASGSYKQEIVEHYTGSITTKLIQYYIVKIIVSGSTTTNRLMENIPLYNS